LEAEFRDMDKKVSVLIITYNHEKYIAQAVESALHQEVNFPYEIVIGEDCSTDHTRNILKDLSTANPERIRLFLRQNKGGGLPGKSNFVETLKACQGQYVALLDGDDYWTDVRKLRKQVDFLDTNPDFAVSFHNVKVSYEDECQEPWNYCSTNQKEISTLEDLLDRNFIATSSTVFRRDRLGELPGWFSELKTGDWALHILNARNGKVGYINEVMSVYRIHQAGYWSKQDTIQSTLDEIAMFKVLLKYLPRKYKGQVKSHLASLFYRLAGEYSSRGNRSRAVINVVRCISASPRNRAIPFRHAVHISFPRVISRLKSFMGGKIS
jgi:glycosyltransferase involved in cell wall biosynthesis